MKSFAEKQAEIEQRRAEAIANYPEMWSRLISEWRACNSQDRAWLMYAASYLVRSGNVRWALDPLWLQDWLPANITMDVTRDLIDLDLILLTHEHGDHLDLGLIRALRDLPICWIVPQEILPLVQETGLSQDKIIVPQMMVPLQIAGMTIWPFEGMHWADAAPVEEVPEGRRGVPATGYLVECSGKRWLFPGDVRTYDVSRLPPLENVDILFAHLWLGRGSAMVDPPPLLDAFCRFCLAPRARHVVLTHLEEFGRDANDLWDAGHVRQVLARLRALAPALPVTPAYMGDSIDL